MFHRSKIASEPSEISQAGHALSASTPQANGHPDHESHGAHVHRIEECSALHVLAVEHDRILAAKLAADLVQRSLHGLAAGFAAEIGDWFIAERVVIGRLPNDLKRATAS